MTHLTSPSGRWDSGIRSWSLISAAEIPPDKTYICDMVHLNDTGSRYAAGLIAARLKSVIAP